MRRRQIVCGGISVPGGALCIVVLRSRITGHWNYCPEPALSMLKLDMDDKPTGLATSEAAIAAARADKSIPKGSTFRVLES